MGGLSVVPWSPPARAAIAQHGSSGRPSLGADSTSTKRKTTRPRPALPTGRPAADVTPSETTRCRHDLLPGQCADCARPAAEKKATTPLTGPAATAQIERLVKALLAQQRGIGKEKAVRKGLAKKVLDAGASLSKADRRIARRMAIEQQQPFRPTRAQLAHEDKVAGIYQGRTSAQNVGRGKRS